MKSQTKRALFVHHSVGRYIMQHGGLREQLAAGLGPKQTTIELWDHDYNKFGLSDSAGTALGRSFPIPDDNTDPGGLVKLFESRAAPYFDELLSFDLVLAKSCYPNSGIKSSARLDELKRIYQQLFAAVAQCNIEFVLLTSPPLAPLRTNAQEAARARELAEWLAKQTPAANIRIFNLFDVLAEADGSRQAGMLRKEYRRFLPFDSHPNVTGSKAAAQALTRFLGENMLHLNPRSLI